MQESNCPLKLKERGSKVAQERPSLLNHTKDEYGKRAPPLLSPPRSQSRSPECQHEHPVSPPRSQSCSPECQHEHPVEKNDRSQSQRREIPDDDLALPYPWLAVDGDDGIFYHNEETGESQWEHPLEDRSPSSDGGEKTAKDASGARCEKRSGLDMTLDKYATLRVESEHGSAQGKRSGLDMTLDTYANSRVESEHGSAQGRHSSRRSEDDHRHRDRRRSRDHRPPPGPRPHKRRDRHSSDKTKLRSRDRKSTKDVYGKLRVLLSPPRSSGKDHGHTDGRRDVDLRDNGEKRSRQRSLLSPEAYSTDKKQKVSSADLRGDTHKDAKHDRGSHHHESSSARHHRDPTAGRKPLLSPGAYSRHSKTHSTHSHDRHRHRRSRSRHRRDEKRHKSRSAKKSVSDRLGALLSKSGAASGGKIAGISVTSQSVFGGGGVWKEPSPPPQRSALAAPMQGTGLAPRVRPSAAPSVAPKPSSTPPLRPSQWPDPEGGPRPPAGPPPPHVLRQHLVTTAVLTSTTITH